MNWDPQQTVVYYHELKSAAKGNPLKLPARQLRQRLREAGREAQGNRFGIIGFSTAELVLGAKAAEQLIVLE